MDENSILKPLSELKQKMRLNFPWLRIVGTYSPPFRILNSIEERKLIKLIDELKPDIIWIGLSTPKQELFMKEYLPKLNTKLMFGIGAAFDFYTGRVRQAPKIIQYTGFEWLFRLLLEPKRLWKRYAKIIPIFIWMILLQSLGLKQYKFKKEKVVTRKRH
ncbi:MAG: WecB/TagA/CpsF family glycosyltransferase [Bacteroidetes bacterium]|nr:WecB/TagA/CpsF family glycosyltransferase [Bacteroidota bacterium]